MVISASVGRHNSSTSGLRLLRALEGRMRRLGRRLRDERISFLLRKPRSWHDSKSSGRRGARVVRGDRPYVGIVSLSVSKLVEGGVGIAKKDRSFSGFSVTSFTLLSNRSNIGCPASVDGRY